MRRAVVITGGVSSSLGKGIFTASLALLLQSSGYKVSIIKCDPYLNVDAGTMNPYQHGEVFVTADGGETDLDLGHYERFTNQKLSKNNNLTSGKVYRYIIEAERRGDYLGETVTMIPHVTDTIKSMLAKASGDSDIALIEIGGTVGDIESLAFLEASRQLSRDLGRGNVVYAHVTLVPYLESAQEFKTKPTQHSIKELMRNGISPDILVLRSSKPLPDTIPSKLSVYSGIPPEMILRVPNVRDPYEVPLNLADQNAHVKVLSLLNLHPKRDIRDDEAFSRWEEFLNRLFSPKTKKSKVTIVGKYVKLRDAYLSLVEALKHASASEGIDLELRFLDAREASDTDVEEAVLSSDGIIVPGGFGISGIEKKILAIKVARENGVPFLGLCLGFQLAVIEVARNVLRLANANSQEFDPETPHPVIRLRSRATDIGGTMRLGEKICYLREGSRLRGIYGLPEIKERFRHRYEFNPDYIDLFQRSGVTLPALSTEGVPQAIEMPDHPFFIGVQFHAEFTSRPLHPSPLFRAFLRATVKGS